ncbi:MAG TPA: hypothetical protein VGL77_19255 [Armatimonadota bacterium]|jgi:hypothetical protein
MKRFLIFLIILALALGGGYIWWQRNAQRLMTAQVRQLARNFFVNPEKLVVETSPIRLRNFSEALVPKLVISGQQLALKKGPTLAYAKLILTDVTVSGPPFRMRHIGGGSYLLKVTDKEVTEYLHTRGGSLGGFKIIPLDSVSVHFLAGSDAATELTGEAVVPVINQRLPMKATGMLTPSSAVGKVDFQVKKVSIKNFSFDLKEVQNALTMINPVVDLSAWPIQCDVRSIHTQPGSATLQGHIIGVSRSLLP